MFYIRYYWILYIYCTSAGIFSLFLFIHQQCDNAQDWVYYYNLESSLEKEYDFVVVGSGTAGAVVAARLAENTEHKVLLVEAGGEPISFLDIPLISPLLQQTNYDWQYKTVSQQLACYGMINQESRWPAGKILGGTSRLNYMVYLRGHYLDYNSWMHGNDWTFQDILYYFRKSEHQQGSYKNSHYHGTKGPFFVSDFGYPTELGNNVLKAGLELGYNTVDLNDLTSENGFMFAQVTGHKGSRWSADHVLKNSLKSTNNGNVKILTNTIVEKVLLLNGFEANGIQYRRNGHVGQIDAKKSVILSAGTIGSAKILLLSGIGPEHILEHNIEQLVNLPVGENLQDHITTGADLIIINETLPITISSIIQPISAAYNYLMKGQGVLTHSGCEVVGLFHIENKSIPDLQLMVLPSGFSSDAGAFIKRIIGVTEKVWQEYFFPLIGEQVVSILPTLLHPKSRGYVRLRSSNPNDLPVIDPKYLTHPDDVRILVKGIRFVQKLIKTKSLIKMGARLYEKSMPGCEQFKFDTDTYWECYVRHLTLTSYHPVGTCKMGLDESSVVDYNLRVHKTNKLHVIDASIMPTLPSANTNAAVIMIAEKGADIVKYLWHMNKHKCHLIEIFLPAMTTTAAS